MMTCDDNSNHKTTTTMVDDMQTWLVTRRGGWLVGWLVVAVVGGMLIWLVGGSIDVDVG